MKLIRLMCPKDKWNVKCPYSMKAKKFVVHNTANKASAKAEISYMIGNNNQVSYHYAIDDVQIVQGIEENRNTWNAGDGAFGEGNREAISFEICHSTNPDINKFKNAEKLASKFIAYKLKERGWGIDRVTKHQDYSGKYCPHKTLDLGWKRFLDMIQEELDILNKNVSNDKKSKTKKKKIDVKYQVYTNKWLPNVKNTEDYAGIYGSSISGFRGNIEGNAEKLKYKVHTKNDSWLGEIQNRQKDKSGDDFAGILGKPIDAIMIKSTKGKARYRVHTKNGTWLPWVTGYKEKDHNNGYAGILGKEIDGIQVDII